MSFVAFLAFLFVVSNLRSRRRLSHDSYASHNALWESDYLCNRFYLKNADERTLCRDAERLHHSLFCRDSMWFYQPGRNWTEYGLVAPHCEAARDLLMQYNSRWWWHVVDFGRCVQFLAHTMGEM